MEQEISKHLQELAEKRLWKNKLEIDLASVKTKLSGQQELLSLLEEKRLLEKQDVDLLKGLTLKALFASILGSKEEQIQKERQELLRVEMQIRSTRHLIDSLQSDANHLQDQINQLKNIEVDYQQAFKQKEQYLINQNPKTATEILENSNRLAQSRNQIKEIEEAIQAGLSVQEGLNQMLKSLNSANNWGIWDMLDGGLLVTMIKHDHMDTARDASDMVKAKITTFQRELKDVSQFEELYVDIEPLERFADLLLDSLIFDWVVQSKIIRSREHTLSAISQVGKVLQTLETRLMVAKGELQKLTSRYSALVEKGG